MPKYITDGLEGVVKIIDLGSRVPIETLLGVVQKEDVSHAEVLQNSCHCLQFNSIANELKCAIFIAWSQRRDHELYGGEHKDNCLYTIVVHKHEHVRTYYMVVVNNNQNGSYTYDLSKVIAGCYNTPSQAFVHKGQNCQGPVSMGICCTHGTVPVIETADIILNDNE